MPASGGRLIQHPSGKYARRLSAVSNLPTSRRHPAAGPVRQGGLCHASTHIQSQANTQACHGAAAHRDRLALARPLDQAAALRRAYPIPQPCTEAHFHAPATRVPRTTAPSATATTLPATNASPTLRLTRPLAGTTASPSAASSTSASRDGELVVSVAPTDYPGAAHAQYAPHAPGRRAQRTNRHTVRAPLPRRVRTQMEHRHRLASHAGPTRPARPPATHSLWRRHRHEQTGAL
ncbi:hypothetical protein CFBP7900_02110 [Xanthomonas hortorum pv. carotae]|uniref:Uncharacterized protein n=1 Tax=Xanthomonas hortorum pv. carotae TaxID=487904 RepID=A0A6V7BMC2_9XANT|nr:hypothetical protein CFBP7900_02110 [Xanthomonas hortorum pv. carotae]CAD0303433.1 hypothetical protein CFBP7900_02110 [Xanthomonas hortorum pv. carotae]